MVVEVRLFAKFRQGRFKKKEMELPEGSSLSDLLEHLKISQKEAMILLVNGDYASTECILSPADVISIFPLLAGG